MNTQQQKKFKILLIGESCIDVYQFGTVTRISPEAPVPILDYTKTAIKLGMASNVLSNLEIYGDTITFLTNKESIYKYRFIDEKTNTHLLRGDQDVKISPLMDLPSDQFDVVIISDYDKGFIPFNLINKVIEKYDCPIFIDTKKSDMSNIWHEPLTTFLKINETEYRKLINFDHLYNNIIVTKGKDGTTFRGETFLTDQVTVFDVCGAGDVFLASVARKYIETYDMKTSIQYANKRASLSVQYLGCVVPPLDDSERIIK